MIICRTPPRSRAEIKAMKTPQTSTASDAAPCCASWITLGDGVVHLENGIYQIEGSDDHYDPELPPGYIEIYDHPVRGQSYWDKGNDDGSDYAGHASPFFLGRCRLRLIQHNTTESLRDTGVMKRVADDTDTGKCPDPNCVDGVTWLTDLNGEAEKRSCGCLHNAEVRHGAKDADPN